MTTTTDLNAPRARSAASAFTALFLSFTAIGCGESDRSPQGQTPSGTPGASLTTTPTPVATLTQTPTASLDPKQATAFPKAADGRNVRACYNGSCEILVTKRVSIPLHPRFGFKTFSFDPADSTWRYTYPEGGHGSLKFLEPPYSGEWSGPSSTQSLAMRVVATQGSKAVISLRPVD
jgi:hypothetical protein